MNRSSRILPASATEAMGDGNADDFAQEAHAQVLEAAGARVARDRVIGLEPLPRTRTSQLLTVDDHIGMAVVSSGGTRPEGDTAWAEMDRRSEASAAAYERIPGLVENSSKRTWGAPQAVVLGSEIDGRSGYIGTPRVKRLELIKATLLVASARAVVRHHLRQLLGLWTFAACFARSSLSLFASVSYVLALLRRQP